ncbi:MAG: hypothetical protein LUB59_04830 [Candidatus Gastranaerophilales bacterium]|nr:hypothetical protein [Candidatus Gastranaerophilales bacterium]
MTEQKLYSYYGKRKTQFRGDVCIHEYKHKKFLYANGRIIASAIGDGYGYDLRYEFLEPKQLTQTEVNYISAWTKHLGLYTVSTKTDIREFCKPIFTSGKIVDHRIEENWKKRKPYEDDFSLWRTTKIF